MLATAGVRVGGTDFDTALNLAAVMPLLGLGTRLVEKDLPMPNAPYHELATWATINFAYTYKNERALAELVSLACEPEKVARLLRVVRQRLGHRLAFAVEDAKIALSAEERAEVPLAFLEAGLAITATRADFDRAIEARIDRLHKAASDCIAEAGLACCHRYDLSHGRIEPRAGRARRDRAGGAVCASGGRLGSAVRRAGIDADGGDQSLGRRGDGR